MNKLINLKIYIIIVTKECFEHENIIGKGGFGKVWRVKVKKYNKEFAMKEMLKKKYQTKEVKKVNKMEKVNIIILGKTHGLKEYGKMEKSK